MMTYTVATGGLSIVMRTAIHPEMTGPDSGRVPGRTPVAAAPPTRNWQDQRKSSRVVSPNWMIWSMKKKNIEATVAIAKTIAVVTSNSLRVGQTTFETSDRTCCMN